MKKLSILFLFTVLLSSCMSFNGIYKVGLQEVECPKNIKEQFGETKVANFQDQGVTKYSYEDGQLKIIWLPSSTQFNFTLTNKSEHTLKIVWDDAVYISTDGTSQKIMHSGVKYIDRNNSQPATTVIKGAKIDDLIMPTDNIYYVSGQYGGWREAPLFKNWAATAEELKVISSSFVGKVVRVMLPIKIEDTTNEYIFTFKIEDFVSKNM